MKTTQEMHMYINFGELECPFKKRLLTKLKFMNTYF